MYNKYIQPTTIKTKLALIFLFQNISITMQDTSYFKIIKKLSDFSYLESETF